MAKVPEVKVGQVWRAKGIYGPAKGTVRCYDEAGSVWVLDGERGAQLVMADSELMSGQWELVQDVNSVGFHVGETVMLGNNSPLCKVEVRQTVGLETWYILSDATGKRYQARGQALRRPPTVQIPTSSLPPGNYVLERPHPIDDVPTKKLLDFRVGDSVMWGSNIIPLTVVSVEFGAVSGEGWHDGRWYKLKDDRTGRTYNATHGSLKMAKVTPDKDFLAQVCPTYPEVRLPYSTFCPETELEYELRKKLTGGMREWPVCKVSGEALAVVYMKHRSDKTLEYPSEMSARFECGPCKEYSRVSG